MKVLVTGGAGFIGRSISKYFSKEGYEVHGCGRGELSEKQQLETGFSSWHGGTVSPELLRQLNFLPDAVIHCAGGGSVDKSLENPGPDYSNSVESTKFILEYVRCYAPRAKFIFPSSAAVFGSFRNEPIAVSIPPNPISAYGHDKLIAENVCESYRNTYGLDISIVRLFSVYGKELKKQLLWDACNKFKKGDIALFWGDGSETRDFIHIKDVLELFDLVINSNIKNYPYKMNCGSGSQYNIKNIISMLRDYYRYTGEISFNNQVRIEDPRHYLSDNTESYRYGWKPKEDLNLGLEEYVTWFKSLV